MKRRWPILVGLALGIILGTVVIRAVSESTILSAIESAFSGAWRQAFGNANASRRAAKVLSKVLRDHIPSTEAGDNRTDQDFLHAAVCVGGGMGGANGVFGSTHVFKKVTPDCCYYHWVVPGDHYTVGDAFVVEPHILSLGGCAPPAPNAVFTVDVSITRDSEDAATADCGILFTQNIETGYASGDLIHVTSTAFTGVGCAGRQLAENDHVAIEFCRDGSNPLDDCMADVQVGGVLIQYTAVPFGS